MVLDLNMPDMGGEECLRELRSIDPDLPVILSSGFGEADTARKFPIGDVTGFLQKPYSAGRLAECVTAALSGSRVRTSTQSV